MEIKITLDSAALQERFDRGGVTEVAQFLNAELGYHVNTKTGRGPGRVTTVECEVLDANGNVAGSWEVRG